MSPIFAILEERVLNLEVLFLIMPVRKISIKDRMCYSQQNRHMDGNPKQ